MKLKHFRLVLNVSIDPQGETTLNLDRQLHRVVSNAVNNGLLTGNTPATVETYDYSIKQVRSVKKSISAESKAIIGFYPNGECPDCGQKIRKTIKAGEDCTNCGHVFDVPKDDDDAAEQQRRDEKNGLYPDKVDIAN